MKIFIWAKDEIDLVEELNGLNSLLVKYEAKDYYEFKVCLDHLLRSFVLLDQAFIFFCEKKKEKKVNNEYNFLVSTWRSTDGNGSTTWQVYLKKLSILFYFNDET